jgi:Phytanoyl-CoA dioxygenase (PhyH)
VTQENHQSQTHHHHRRKREDKTFQDVKMALDGDTGDTAMAPDTVREEDRYPTDESDEDEDRIHASDGLSPDVLAALLEFQMCGCEKDDDVKLDKDTLCATYRPEDAQKIAETLRRLQERHELQNAPEQLPSEFFPETTLSSPQLYRSPNQPDDDVADPVSDPLTQKYIHDLAADGVIRIDHVLSKELCAAILDFTNQSLDKAEEDSNQNDRRNETMLFGNVFERANRFDMYLRPTAESVVDACLHSLLNAQSPLGMLFSQLLLQSQANSQDVDRQNCNKIPNLPFHELSCLISDPGSVAQPLHPDSPYYPVQAPMWTVFCALQPVSRQMGPTVVVPGTHTKRFHDPPAGANVRTLMHQECTYRRAELSTGDCIVMDARTFHYGSANMSSSDENQRRSLLYFTLRNPFHVATGYPPSGSLYPDLDGTLTTAQYII